MKTELQLAAGEYSTEYANHFNCSAWKKKESLPDVLCYTHVFKHTLYFLFTYI
jgi:hypothetical protein